MRNPSLSSASTKENEREGQGGLCYRAWSKKPNYLRVEMLSASGEASGIMVGDGSRLWVYWPNGRPKWPLVKESDADQETRFTSYMMEPATLERTYHFHMAQDGVPGSRSRLSCH